ncbi:MAG: hypothetical protein R3Y29_01235 [bacterium]
MAEILNLFENNINNLTLKDNQVNLLIDVITSSTISYEAYVNLSSKIKDDNITNFLFNALSFTFPTPECIELLKQQPDLLNILKNCVYTPFDEIKADIFFTCLENKFNLIGELYYNMLCFVNKKYRNHLKIAGDTTTNTIFSVLHILNDPINANNPSIVNSFEAYQHRLISNYVPNLKVIVKGFINRFLAVKSGEFEIKIGLSNDSIPQNFWQRYPSQEALFNILEAQILNKINNNKSESISTKVILNTANNYEIIGYILYVLDTSNNIIIPKVYDMFIINEYRGIKISKSILGEIINAYPTKCGYMITRNPYTIHNSIEVNQGFRLITLDTLNLNNITSINQKPKSKTKVEFKIFNYGQDEKADSVIEWYCTTHMTQRMVEKSMTLEQLSIVLAYDNNNNNNIGYLIFDSSNKVIYYINTSEDYINQNIEEDLVERVVNNNQDIWTSSLSNQNFIFWRKFKKAIILKDVVNICSDIKNIKKY